MRIVDCKFFFVIKMKEKIKKINVKTAHGIMCLDEFEENLKKNIERNELEKIIRKMMMKKKYKCQLKAQFKKMLVNVVVKNYFYQRKF